MPPDPNELVLIKHPQIKTLGGPVTRQAFDDVYAAKGWSLATDKDVVAAADAETTTSGKDK